MPTNSALNSEERTRRWERAKRFLGENQKQLTLLTSELFGMIARYYPTLRDLNELQNTVDEIVTYIDRDGTLEAVFGAVDASLLSIDYAVSTGHHMGSVAAGRYGWRTTSYISYRCIALRDYYNYMLFGDENRRLALTYLIAILGTMFQSIFHLPVGFDAYYDPTLRRTRIAHRPANTVLLSAREAFSYAFGLTTPWEHAHSDSLADAARSTDLGSDSPPFQDFRSPVLHGAGIYTVEDLPGYGEKKTLLVPFDEVLWELSRPIDVFWSGHVREKDRLRSPILRYSFDVFHVMFEYSGLFRRRFLKFLGLGRTRLTPVEPLREYADPNASIVRVPFHVIEERYDEVLDLLERDAEKRASQRADNDTTEGS